MSPPPKPNGEILHNNVEGSFSPVNVILPSTIRSSPIFLLVNVC